MFVHYANILTADINQYKPQWRFNMDKFPYVILMVKKCVCVCV